MGLPQVPVEREIVASRYAQISFVYPDLTMVRLAGFFNFGFRSSEFGNFLSGLSLIPSKCFKIEDFTLIFSKLFLLIYNELQP